MCFVVSWKRTEDFHNIISTHRIFTKCLGVDVSQNSLRKFMCLVLVRVQFFFAVGILNEKVFRLPALFGNVIIVFEAICASPGQDTWLEWVIQWAQAEVIIAMILHDFLWVFIITFPCIETQKTFVLLSFPSRVFPTPNRFGLDRILSCTSMRFNGCCHFGSCRLICVTNADELGDCYNVFGKSEVKTGICLSAIVPAVQKPLTFSKCSFSLKTWAQGSVFTPILRDISVTFSFWWCFYLLCACVFNT